MKTMPVFAWLLALCMTTGLLSSVNAQFSMGSQASRDSLNRLLQEDYQNMQQQLQITSLRPGKNGSNPNAPNYANYDESKANPFPQLPDPLTLNNGKKVTSEKVWWKKRRPEIAELFDREVYGRMPAKTPKVEWVVKNTTKGVENGIEVITKELEGVVDNSAYPAISVKIQLTLTTPAAATGPVPVIMEFGFIFPGMRNGMFPGMGATGEKSWQQQVLEKGWGYAILFPNSIQADQGSGLRDGIIGLVNKGNFRKPDDWGSLRAWGWGASRAIDYFETDPSVDTKRIALEGHSRYGKATLVAMAYEPRIAIGFVSSSGAGGASLYRRDYGEIIENVAASNEYHWMAGNFLKYAGPLQWTDLPVDAHQIIAMCAPRPIFISSGSDKGDGWADPKGMFMAAAAAGPVYRLLGKKDLGTDQFPPVETALIEGEVAYRQHSGGHTTGPNWPVFLQFAERQFNVSKR